MEPRWRSVQMIVVHCAFCHWSASWDAPNRRHAGR